MKKIASLFLTPALALIAQAPEPATTAAPQAATATAAPQVAAVVKDTAPSQALRSAMKEADGLLKALNPREAFAKLEATLPAEVPEWDKSNPQTQVNSKAHYEVFGYAFHLAGKAADQSGNWEKALELFTKSRAIYKTNSDKVAESFPFIVTYYKNLAAASKRNMVENADYIKQLKEKKDPDPGDKQQIDLIQSEEENIPKHEKMAETFEGYIENAKKTSDFYGQFVDTEDQWLKGQIDELDKYRFKNDKVRFVEGIMSAKTYLDQQFPVKEDRVRYLYRLNVLDPSNRKVVKEIENLTGLKIEAVGSDKFAAPAKKTKKK